MQDRNFRQAVIRLGTHGENYGNWMPLSMLFLAGRAFAVMVALTIFCFTAFYFSLTGAILAVTAAVMLVLLLWITWIRRQYAFGGGGMMERVHEIVLSHLDFDGQGQLLDVGCGSGTLSIRAALTWRVAQVLGIDYWNSAYGYGQSMCKKRRERGRGRPVPVPAWGRKQAGLPGREFRRRGEQTSITTSWARTNGLCYGRPCGC